MIHASDGVDLRGLVAHTSTVPAEATIESVQKLFEQSPFSFLAVLEQEKVLGICSRRDIGTRLGTRYGFAVFGRKPIALFVRDDFRVSTLETFSEVLAKVFGRSENTAFDDVLLVDENDAFVGLIFARDLVRLQTRILLESASQLEKQNREIETRRAELEEEILMAKEIQNAFLPTNYPVFASPKSARSALNFHHYYQPASNIGGDFVSVRKVSESTAAIFFGDVMGHGVRSALITAMLRALVEEIAGSGLSAGEVLGRMNRDLKSMLKNSKTPIFVSCLFLHIDLKHGVLEFANGGHPAPLLIRGKANKLELLEPENGRHGLAIGLIDTASYETHRVDFAVGDGLFLFTDGAFEIERNGEELGLDQLMEAVAESLQRNPREIIEAVVNRIRLFAGNEPLPDDICLLALERMA